VRVHYPDDDLQSICDHLGVTMKMLYQQAAFLNVKRSDAALEKAYEISGTKSKERGSAFWFKKGDTPINKGKKQSDFMTPDVIERTKRTRYKKGHMPGNRKAVGYERLSIDGYVYVKTKDGAGRFNWVLKHRLLYEQNNGPIPTNSIVEFADGDTMNFDIENLVLKTRAQNIDANRFKDSAIVKRCFKIKEPEAVAEFIRLYPELIELKRNEIKLNGKLRQLKAKVDGPGGQNL